MSKQMELVLKRDSKGGLILPDGTTVLKDKGLANKASLTLLSTAPLDPSLPLFLPLSIGPLSFPSSLSRLSISPSPRSG